MAYRKALPGATTRGMIPPAAGLGPQPKSQQQSEQEAQDMLASFGSRILEMLRAGGKSLENMDNRYADAVYDRFGNGNSTVGNVIRGGSNEPIMNIIKSDAQGVPGLVATKYGMLGANLASRYALPAGGVMLAGKGLADLTNGLYDYASEQPIL